MLRINLDYRTKQAKIIAALRLLARYWSPKKEARKAAMVMVDKGLYKNGNQKKVQQFKCRECAELFGTKEVQVDHIDPVVSVERGFTDWNDYIDRLFCSVDNLQVLCKPCHKVKSKIENATRRNNAKDEF